MLLSRICFLCLDDNDKNLQTVFSEDGDNILLLNKIEYLLSSDLLILEPDNPERICSSCVNKLNFFYNFKQSSLENAIRVKQLIRSEKMSVNKVTNHFQPINENMSNNDTAEFEEETPNNNENDNEAEADKFCENNDDDSPGNITENQDSVDVQEINTAESFLEIKIDIEDEIIDLANTNDNNNYNETEPEQNQCDQNTASVSNVDPNQSQNSAMSQETNERFQCHKCERSYKNKNHLNRHFKEVHWDLSETFQCDICEREFEYKRHLTQHLQSHQKHVCKICGTSFKGKKSLSNHMKRHDPKPSKNGKYLCTECNIRYSMKYAYNHHLITQHGVQDFKCSVCNKSFLNKATMRKHEKIHEYY